MTKAGLATGAVMMFAGFMVLFLFMVSAIGSQGIPGSSIGVELFWLSIASLLIIVGLLSALDALINSNQKK